MFFSFVHRGYQPPWSSAHGLLFLWCSSARVAGRRKCVCFTRFALPASSRLLSVAITLDDKPIQCLGPSAHVHRYMLRRSTLSLVSMNLFHRVSQSQDFISPIFPVLQSDKTEALLDILPSTPQGALFVTVVSVSITEEIQPQRPEQMVR